jgi:hypothetical protein
VLETNPAAAARSGAVSASIEPATHCTILRVTIRRVTTKPTLLVASLAASLCSSAALAARVTYLAAPAAQRAIPSAPWLRVDRGKLCVTNGVISALADGRLAIDTPSSRAVVRAGPAQSAEIRFRYLGPSASAKPLASGELRRQIGVKLRAQDTCNLLYAMWHIEPDSRIAVSVKRNAGKHTHEECGAGGYLNIKPRTSLALPRIQPGESHTLRAELHGTDLTLVADGRTVWEGSVGNVIAEFNGPVGLRTDNARFELQYYAGPVDPLAQSSSAGNNVNPCRLSPGD